MSDDLEARREARRRKRQQEQEGGDEDQGSLSRAAVGSMVDQRLARRRLERQKQRESTATENGTAEESDTDRRRRERRESRLRQDGDTQEEETTSSRRNRRRATEEDVSEDTSSYRRRRRGGDDEEEEQSKPDVQAEPEPEPEPEPQRDPEPEPEDAAAVPAQQEDDSAAREEEERRRREAEEADAERQRQEEERRRRQEEERRELEERRRRGRTTPRRERQSRPKQRTPRGPKQTPRSARQQVTSGFLSARSIPEEESANQQQTRPPPSVTATEQTKPSVTSAKITKSEVRPERINHIPEKKPSSALATIAGEPNTSKRPRKQAAASDPFSKSLDATSAKQVIPRKMSDSSVTSYNRPSPSLLDTGFSGTFDIRAKIAALEKKTNKRIQSPEPPPPKIIRGEQIACASLVLSPKPESPLNHRSIQVVSQTPRETSGASDKVSPPSSHHSQKDGTSSNKGTQPARDALWSVKSVSDIDDRLTDIVASNRKMLYSDDTIERFTDFELGSSYDDIFVSASSENRSNDYRDISNKSGCSVDTTAGLLTADVSAHMTSTLNELPVDKLSQTQPQSGASSSKAEKQPKSILKSKPVENNVVKDSSLSRTKTRASQRERDLKRSTSRGRHGTPSRSPLPDTTTSSSSDTDDGHFIPFTMERDDVLRDPRAVQYKHRPGGKDFTDQQENTSTKFTSFSQQEKRPVSHYEDKPLKSYDSNRPTTAPNLESMSENESMFSGDDVSARNSVSLATSMEHLSSGPENDMCAVLGDDGDTNDVTLTLVDSTEFDDVEEVPESESNKTEMIDYKASPCLNTSEDQVKWISPRVHRTTLALPQEDDHGDSDTLEPIAASGFYGVKSDIPFSSKKRKINNRKSGQKISQMTSIWSKMPIVMNAPSSKGEPAAVGGFNIDGAEESKGARETTPRETKIRKTSLGFETPRSFRESADTTPVVVVNSPDVEVNSPKASQERKKSWTAGGTKEKLDELFGKLNSKLKSREGSSASASPQDEMLGEQQFEPMEETYHHGHLQTYEEDKDVEVSCEEYYDQTEAVGYSNTPDFLAPFDSSIDAIQRSHSQPVLSSRDDMSYYDQSRSIHEYIATDEADSTGRMKSKDCNESAKFKQPGLHEASQAFWEIPGTPRRKHVSVGENEESFMYTMNDETNVIDHAQRPRHAESGASSSTSGHREDAASNLSNRSMINSESDYDAEEVDPLTCAADYDDYRENHYTHEGYGMSEHVQRAGQSFHQEHFLHSTSFNVNPKMLEANVLVARQESLISTTSNMSVTSNQGSVSIGSFGNSGRAPPGNAELIERRAHTEEWLVDDIILKGASPRVGNAEVNSDVPSTASSVADSMSAATAGSECDIDEEDINYSYGEVVEEEGFYADNVEGGDYYDGQGFHFDQTGQYFYHTEDQGFGYTNSDPDDELKLELGFLNNSSEEDEDYYDEGQGNFGGGGEFSSDKCVDGSSHHNYTDSSDEYDDYMDPNDTVMYTEEYPDQYSQESGEIPGDIMQTMDELGEDILQYLSDEMEEEGEAEEWGEEDPEGCVGQTVLKYPLQEDQTLAPNSQSPTEPGDSGMTGSNCLIFYTPNNVSCVNENPSLENSSEYIDGKSEDISNAGNILYPRLNSTSIHNNTQNKPFHQVVPTQFKDTESMPSPLQERNSEGFGRGSSSQNFVEVMTDSARLREQFKEHHGHIDDKDIVHVDRMSEGHDLPDNDEFFISFEIDEAHRLSYRQYGDDDGRSPENAFYEYLQDAGGSPGQVSLDQDNVFTHESPLTSLSDSHNKSSLQSNHTVVHATEEPLVESQESRRDTFYTDDVDSDTTVDFAQKQNLLTEIRTHYQNKDIKKKLVTELKHFDLKSLKHADITESSEKPEEVSTVLSPVLPSVVRRLSQEQQDETLQHEFPPPVVGVQRLGQMNYGKSEKENYNTFYSPERNKTLQDDLDIDKSDSTNASQSALANKLDLAVTQDIQISNPTTSQFLLTGNSCIETTQEPYVHVVSNYHRQISPGKQENHVPTVYIDREALSQHGEEHTSRTDTANTSASDKDQSFSQEDASKRRRASVDNTGRRLSLSKERRKSIRSFWEQLDEEKQKKKEAEETWQRRRSDLKLKQMYHSQSLSTGESQSVKLNSKEFSKKDNVTKAFSQDSATPALDKKPPPPPVAPKPQRGKSAHADRKSDLGVSVKQMAQLHETDSNDTSQRRRSRGRAQVNHSELAAAIMKRQKELAQQNLAAVAASAVSGSADTCSEKNFQRELVSEQTTPCQDVLAITSPSQEERASTGNIEPINTIFKNHVTEDSTNISQIMTTNLENPPTPSSFVATPSPPQPHPALKRQDPISSSLTSNNASVELPEIKDSISGSTTVHPKPPVKACSVPRPSFNAKALAKGNTFLPSFARRSYSDIPTSVTSTDLTIPTEDPGLHGVYSSNVEAPKTTASVNNVDLNPATNPTFAKKLDPAPVTKEMKLWVTDYLKDMIVDKHRRETELDSFGSRISSESTSVNTSFSANTSFYGHLPLHTHHKDPLSIDLQSETSSSPRHLAASVGKLSIADRINKMQEKMNSSKESVKETENLGPTQSQQQFASMLQTRLIDVIAQETEEPEKEKQVKSRKPPPSAWALERQRLFGKGRVTPKGEDWGEPNSTSTPTASEQKFQTNDPSAQLENLSQSLSQSDVVKMSLVRRGRKPRRHTAGGPIFDIVEKFNSPDSSSPESWTPIERTRPNSPWVAKLGASPQSPLVSQVVNKLTSTTDSDKSSTERPANLEYMQTNLVSRFPHANKVASVSQVLDGEVGGVISGTFDKSIVSELLKKVELSGDESGSTSLSNSSSFQAGSLRKHSLEGSKIAELKLKLTAESRSSSNSSLSHSLDHRPQSTVGDSGVRNIVSRLESPIHEITAGEAFPRNQAKPFSWKPLSVINSNSNAVEDDMASYKGPAPPVAPKNKRMSNERRHTTQVNFDELREKYNSMAHRREHHTPPQSKALWAVNAASSRSEKSSKLYEGVHLQNDQNNRRDEIVSFGVAQSSIFRKSTSSEKPEVAPSSVLNFKNERSMVEDALPAELEYPLMTSSARQPPAMNMTQFSSHNSVTNEPRKNSKTLSQATAGIKELEQDNDTVYSPLSSARVPEAYNLPLDVVPTPDPRVSSDNFCEDVSFGELAESESSDTFEFYKKRAEIKEEFLIRQQIEKEHAQESAWYTERKLQHQHQDQFQQHQHHYQQSEQQQHQHQGYNSDLTSHEITSSSPQVHRHHENRPPHFSSCPQSHPARYTFPETIIDTRTATGHVVCRVLSEVPLEPDESGIGGSDNSLGSGSTSTLDKGGPNFSTSLNRPILHTASQTHRFLSKNLSMPPNAHNDQSRPKVVQTQHAHEGSGVEVNQQNCNHHSQEDFGTKLGFTGELSVSMGNTETSPNETHRLTSPRRASFHDIHSSSRPCSSSSVSMFLSNSNISNSQHTGSHTTATISSSVSNVFSTSNLHTNTRPCVPEDPNSSTYFSNPSPIPFTLNSAKGEKASKAPGEKEKRRRSKSKFMQEIEKKRNSSEPTGRAGTDDTSFERRSSRKANLSSSDVPSGPLESLEEHSATQTRSRSKALFGPTVSRKKSSGAIDGDEGEATVNTMQGYSKRFDRLWARFDPNPAPEEKSEFEHAHESATSLHGKNFPVPSSLAQHESSHDLDLLAEPLHSYLVVADQKEEEERRRQEEEEAEQKRMEEEEAERIKAEEEAKKKKGGKRKGLGGLSAEKKKLLKKLIMQKAAEDLRNEAMQKAAEKEKYINDRVPILKTEGLGQSELEKLVKDLHSKVSVLEEEVYDWEIKIRKQDFEINELTLKVNDTKGKFMKPVLRKVNKTESKLKKIQQIKESTDFRGNLKSTGQNKFALDEEEPEKNNPHWRDELKPKEKQDDENETTEANES